MLEFVLYRTADILWTSRLGFWVQDIISGKSLEENVEYVMRISF